MSKEIIPKNHYLQTSIYLLTGMGIFPLQFGNKPSVRKTLYFLYYGTLQFYYISILIRQFIELCNLILSGDLRRTMQNVGITLLTAISLIRAQVCRSNYVGKIFDNIQTVEKKVLSCDEEEVKKIYMFYADYSRFINKYFMILGVVTTIPFYIAPFVEVSAYPELYIRDNVTGKVYNRPTPISEWIPYNYHEHYLLSFIWQIFDGILIQAMVVYPDGFLFNLMIFPLGQLRILQYILRNFEKYGNREAHILGVDRDKAAFSVVRACILFHQEIIRYIENLDSAMKYLVLMDFASCSFQMSVILFQIIMQSDFKMPSVFAAEFLLSMVVQMFLFYWHAHQLIVESTGVANAATENEWYNEPKIVKDMLKVLIQRAQKPLTLSIGPFYPMSTDTALSILKATYSYGMLLRKSYERKTGNV